MGEDKHEVVLTSSSICDCTGELQTVACDERNNFEVVQIGTCHRGDCINIGIYSIVSDGVGGITDVRRQLRDI